MSLLCGIQRRVARTTTALVSRNAPSWSLVFGCKLANWLRFATSAVLLLLLLGGRFVLLVAGCWLGAVALAGESARLGEIAAPKLRQADHRAKSQCWDRFHYRQWRPKVNSQPVAVQRVTQHGNLDLSRRPLFSDRSQVGGSVDVITDCFQQRTINCKNSAHVNARSQKADSSWTSCFRASFRAFRVYQTKRLYLFGGPSLWCMASWPKLSGA